MNSERDGKNEKLINKTIPQLLEMNKRKSKFQKEFALEKVNERRNEISKKYAYMVTRTEQVNSEKATIHPYKLQGTLTIKTHRTQSFQNQEQITKKHPSLGCQ